MYLLVIFYYSYMHSPKVGVWKQCCNFCPSVQDRLDFQIRVFIKHNIAGTWMCVCRVYVSIYLSVLHENTHIYIRVFIKHNVAWTWMCVYRVYVSIYVSVLHEHTHIYIHIMYSNILTELVIEKSLQIKRWKWDPGDFPDSLTFINRHNN